MGLLICASLLLCLVDGFWMQGHMLVAQVAYLSMESQGEREKLDWAVRGDGWGFVEGAVWADTLKEQKLRAFDSWHYVNAPFVVDDVVAPPPFPVDLRWALGEMNTAYGTKDASVESRAFALRMLMHLVGDAHQPMHGVTLFSKRFPQGDQGGNLFTLQFRGMNTNLHAFWDSGAFTLAANFSVPLTESQARGLRSQALDIMASYPEESFAPSEIVFNPDLFLSEDYAIGVRDCYLNGSLPLGGQVSDEYAAHAEQVTLQRIALGGYRLASALRPALSLIVVPPSPPSSAWVVVVASFASLGLGVVLGGAASWYVLWCAKSRRHAYTAQV